MRASLCLPMAYALRIIVSGFGEAQAALFAT
jgi:hypothetical protein